MFLLQELEVVLQHQHILFVGMREDDGVVESFLLPEDRHASSHCDMRQQVVMADEDLLALDEVSSIEVFIDAATVVSCP